MRKFKTFIVLLILILTASFLLGCNSPKKIDKMYDKLADAKSVTIEVTTKVVGATFTVTMKIDGDKLYINEFLSFPEQYLETVDGKVYTYTKVNGVWTKDNGVPYNEDSAQGVEEYEKLFKGENYEYSKDDKAFKLKEDAEIDFDGMNINKVLLTIEKNSCKILAEATALGMTTELTMEFKNINKTKVTLPTVS